MTRRSPRSYPREPSCHRGDEWSREDGGRCGGALSSSSRRAVNAGASVPSEERSPCRGRTSSLSCSAIRLPRLHPSRYRACRRCRCLQRHPSRLSVLLYLRSLSLPLVIRRSVHSCRDSAARRSLSSAAPLRCSQRVDSVHGLGRAHLHRTTDRAAREPASRLIPPPPLCHTLPRRPWIRRFAHLRSGLVERCRSANLPAFRPCARRSPSPCRTSLSIAHARIHNPPFQSHGAIRAERDRAPFSRSVVGGPARVGASGWKRILCGCTSRRSEHASAPGTMIVPADGSTVQTVAVL